MKKLLSLSLLCPLILISQVQIGQDIDGEASGDESGRSVSLSSDGTIVAIGAYLNNGFSGHVRVYENQSGTWMQIGQDIDGEAASDRSGYSVSLSSNGTTVAIGAYRNDGNGTNSGHVRVYENQSGTWTQIGQDIDGEATLDNSGYSVSISSDGNTVAIGANMNDGNGPDSGHVRVYKNQSGIWMQIGQDIDGEATRDRSGYSVSLSSDGKIVAIGADFNDGNGISSGHVKVYENLSGTWTQIGQDIDGEASSNFSGRSVSLSSDGLTVAIGAHRNDGSGDSSGHVRVYVNQSGNWVQIGQDIDGEAEGDNSGYSVSLSSDGTTVAIGANFNSASRARAGHVRVYKNQSGTWMQIGQDIDGEESFDESGASVSLSSDGTKVAIGGNLNDGNGSDSGHVRVYNLSTLLSSDDFVLSKFSLFPNPVNNEVTLKLESGLELQQIFIYDNLGRQVFTGRNLVINTSSLTAGLYYLQIKTNKGNGTKKLIIE